MTRFIQITEWYDEEHTNYSSATFKCIGCYNKFSIGHGDLWQWCPKCGNELETVFREIKRVHRGYIPGSHSVVINDELIIIIEPTFTLEIKNRSTFWRDAAWELVERYNKMPMMDSHRNLKWELRNAKQNGNEISFRIIPSKVLPLP